MQLAVLDHNSHTERDTGKEMRGTIASTVKGFKAMGCDSSNEQEEIFIYSTNDI